MKTQLLLTLALFSSFAINAMDLEHGDSQQDLLTIPLETTSRIDQFKTAFADHTTQQLVSRLQALKNQPQDLQMIKNWLKHQKVNSNQELLEFVRNNRLKPYLLLTGVINLFGGILNSTKTGWPFAIIEYLITTGAIILLVIKERNNCQLSTFIQKKIDKNNKIKLLLSAIRNMNNE